jgi:very-short-patch-repair endonuclease
MSDQQRTLARTAASQFGLLTIDQHHAVGVRPGAVKYRRRSGRYDRRARGVDAVAGTPASWHQEVVAACLAVGEHAVGSHRTAARLWNLGTFDGPIELVVPYETSPLVPGVTVHRSLDLAAADRTILDGVPVTTVPRLLVDVGAVLPPFIVERLVERACGRGLTTPVELRSMLDRVARRGRRGCGALRHVLDTRALGDQVGESELEEIFARLCRDYELPALSFQVWVRLAGKDRRIDFAIPDRKLAIEIDGYEPHSRREVFEDDRARQNQLVAAGWTVLRFTRRQLLYERGWVAAMILAVL